MISSFLSFCLRFFRSRIQLQLEIIFLRKQLEILARTSTRPRLRSSDRFFFSVMTDAFDSWKETLLVLKPETVIRWHQRGFGLHWRWKSRSEPGRPKIPQAQVDLIRQVASDNPLWGAPLPDQSTMVDPESIHDGQSTIHDRRPKAQKKTERRSEMVEVEGNIW